MYLEQLEYLVDISETKSFTATAQRLYITQQAVSRSIQQLEKELGIDILIRTKHGIVFTEQGNRVLAFAQKVLQDEYALIDDLGILQGEERDSLAKKINICSASSVINIVLPRIMAKGEVQKQKYDINISITDNVDTLLEQLMSGERDVGLLSVNEKLLCQAMEPYQNDLQMDLLARDDMVMVMDRKYYKGDSRYFDFDLNPDSIHTLYNLIPYDREAFEQHVVCSSDADFHRSMMEEAGAVVCMSGLAQQYFFNKKKYITLQIDKAFNPVIVHAAIYRKTEKKYIKDFIAKIRIEMQMK